MIVIVQQNVISHSIIYYINGIVIARIFMQLILFSMHIKILKYAK